MHWTLADLDALDIEHYEVLMELAPKWLGVEEEGPGDPGEAPGPGDNADREVSPERFKELFTRT